MKHHNMKNISLCRLPGPIRSGGFSLVELLVAMAISLFMILGVSYIYVGSKKTYQVQENLARMQESARLAFEYLSRDVRQGGDFGCASLASAYQAGGSAAACAWPSATVPTVVCTLGGTGCATVGANEPIHGYENVTATITALGITPLSGTDVLELSRAGNPCEGTSSSVSAITIDKDPPGGNAANIGVNVTGTDLANCVQEGDILIASDCKNSVVFQACEVNSSGIVVHSTGNSGGCASPAWGNTCKDWGNNYKGGSLLKLSRNAYYVKNDANGIPTLYRKNLVTNAEFALVPYIESFQVKYGVAATKTGYPTGYQTASGITDWSLVKSVRIDLLIRSPEGNLTTDIQKIYFNSATVTPTDKNLRLVVGSTIGIRNRTLLSTDP